MGWKGKLASKVGHYLSQTLEFPVKHLYTYPEPSKSTREDAAVAGDFQGSHHTSGVSSGEAGGLEDDYGPDTTSLTAFLMSLLSSPNNSSRRYSDHDGTESEDQDSEAHAATSSSHVSATDECLSARKASVSYSGSLKQWAHSVDEDVDVPNSYNSRLHSKLHQDDVPSASPKLPPMSEQSVLLSESLRVFLYTSMPIIIKDRHWILLYSTVKHGISLRTLYRKSAALPDPFLLVAGDFHGAVFGGLLTAPLKPTAKRKYLGTNEMFVFTNVNKNPRIFRTTG
ncbi:hypothetical protein KP509_12G014600 [Ceratopteris richardii]|nr:hypothetical protein KP509_12G014600 [Ceratopteris richardii]